MEWKLGHNIPLKIGMRPHLDKKTLDILKISQHDVINQSNNICVYCGGKYQKLNYCIYTNKLKPKKDNIKACCHMCYLLTNFSPSNCKYVEIRQSTINQLQIIRKTVDYILQNKKMPLPREIDDHSIKININPKQYFAIGETHNDINKKYKVFFTDELDISYVCHIDYDYFKEDIVEEIKNTSEECINVFKHLKGSHKDNTNIIVKEIVTRYRKYLENDIQVSEKYDKIFQSFSLFFLRSHCS